jgi:hypothetical protein
MQLVLLLGNANHQYTPYLLSRDLRLQETCSDPLSLDSANSFASLARTQFLFVIPNLVIF